MKNTIVFIWSVKRLSLAIFFILPMMFSCSSNKEGTVSNNYIDVERAVGTGKILKLSDYASDIQYVPLETREESVLGTIRDISFEDNKFFVRDNNNVIKIFDKSGKYLSTIDRSGRGPQEYNGIVWFKPAPQAKGAYLLDRSGTLFLYEYDGTFIEKRTLPKEENMIFSSFAFIENNLFVATHSLDFKNIAAGDIDYNVFLYDDSLSVINERSFSHNGAVQTKMDGTNIRSIAISIKNIYLHNYNNQIRFLFDSQDTILTVNKEGVFKDAYILNYGKYKDSENSPDFILGEVGKYIKIAAPFFETDSYLYLRFDFGEYAPKKVVTEIRINGEMIPKTDASVNALFNKQSGELILLNMPTPNKRGFVEDIKQGLPFWPRFMGANGELIAYINTFEILDAVESDNQCSTFISDFSATLKEDDNPVVVIVKPKK